MKSINSTSLAILAITTSFVAAHAAHTFPGARTAAQATRRDYPQPPTALQPWYDEEICRCPKGAFHDSPFLSTPWITEKPDWHNEPCCIWQRKHWLALRVATCATIFCFAADE